MTKITLNNVGSLVDYTTAGTTINNNFSTIQTAIDNTLSRDGTSPNTMGDNFDMNSHQILNLPTPATANSPLRLQDLASFTGSGTVSNIPTGGTTGQVLAKVDNTDYNIAWTSESAELTAGLNIALTGTTPTTISTVTTPTFTLTNSTGLPVTTGISGLGTNMSTFLATPSSANLRSAMTDESGTGLNYFQGGDLGTPSAGVLTNATGLPVGSVTGLGTGVGTFLATPSSANLISAVTDETGTGALVFSTTPTLVTPVLGVATATSINKVTVTAPATSAVLTIPDGVTLTGPAVSGTAMTLGNAETVTGAKTFGAAGNVGKLIVAGTTSGTTVLNATAVASGTLTLPAETATLITGATTATLTNKTYDTAGTGNSFFINGVAATANTGTGAVARASTPLFTTPDIGAATGTSLAATGLITSSGTAGIGYATGAGGTVTQATNRSTGVTLNKISGAITLVAQVNSAVSAATANLVTVTNSTVAATDVVIVNQKSGTDKYQIWVTTVAAGSFQILFYTTGGTTNESPVFNFNVIKGVAA